MHILFAYFIGYLFHSVVKTRTRSYLGSSVFLMQEAWRFFIRVDEIFKWWESISEMFNSVQRYVYKEFL